jgi:hypothetical protein
MAIQSTFLVSGSNKRKTEIANPARPRTAPVPYKYTNMSTDSDCKTEDAASCTPCSEDNRTMTALFPPVFTPERASVKATIKETVKETPGRTTVKRKRDHEQSTGLLDNILGNLTKFHENIGRLKPSANDDSDAQLTYNTGMSFRRGSGPFVAPGVPRTKYHCVNPDCNAFNTLETDYANGTIGCRTCGVVQPQKIMIEDERRLFADDDLETRHAKVRAGTESTTCVGDKTLGVAHMKLHGKADEVQKEMYEHLIAYAKFMNWHGSNEDTAIFGTGNAQSLDKETVSKNFASMATHVEKIKKTLEELATFMNVSVPVKKNAEQLCTKFGAQCFLHDRDCCGGPSCRLFQVKKVPPPLAATALLRMAQIEETGTSIQFEVYKATLLKLHTPANVTEKLGKANHLVNDIFKGMPFNCFSTFDAEGKLFKLIGEREETIGFSNLPLLCDDIGFKYPQSLRAKEILDDWKDPPPIMPQTLMGMAILRAVDETKATTVGIADVSNAVGISKDTLTKRLYDYDNLPFPTHIFQMLVSAIGLRADVIAKARERLYAWLGTTPQAYSSYQWTRSAGPWLTPACAIIAGFLDTDPTTDVFNLVRVVAGRDPVRISPKALLECYNKHPSLAKLSISL